jgi:hypothetical protein
MPPKKKIEIPKPTKAEKEELKEIEETPMSNEDIRKYFPNIKIIAYNELKNYNSIEEILPHNKSYAIILYLASPNCGHWTALMRYGNTIEFFCSLGSDIDEPLKWLSKEAHFNLGVYEPYLSRLLEKSKFKLIYSPFPYQKQKDDINTCGRHCIFRIQKMLKGYSLDKYNQIMKKGKEMLKLDFDKLVSALIEK